ncbi:hypothetical protein [Kingella negevensis]|uniref:hypothetical protein n=1 Tax=Kingella negevensis TaxID=1522312 RepID=UPI000B1611EE|nr:hypothetical protein [Kingella negevensis]
MKKILSTKEKPPKKGGKKTNLTAWLNWWAQKSSLHFGLQAAFKYFLITPSCCAMLNKFCCPKTRSSRALTVCTVCPATERLTRVKSSVIIQLPFLI